MKRVCTWILMGILIASMVGCKSHTTGTMDNNPTASDNQAISSQMPDNTEPSQTDAQSSQPSDNTLAPDSTAIAEPTSITAKKTGAPTNKPNDEITQANLMPLYFDLLDTMRTQSLGTTFTTSATERTRVTNLVAGAWSQIDTNTQSTLVQIAQASQAVKSSYSGLSTSDKNTLKAYWKKTVLSPDWIYAPLSNPATYSTSAGGTVSFNYPSDWTGGETSGNGLGYLFLGKNGTSYSWEQVLDASNSAAGSLSILSAVTATEQGMTALQLARACATYYVNGNAPNMKEINAIETSLGAVVVLDGKFPNQSEEKFFWVVIIPNGNQIVMCRMGGPVSQADTLIPTYYNMLNTLNWSSKPTGGGSGSGSGEVSAAFDTAWSQVSTGVVADIWAD